MERKGPLQKFESGAFLGERVEDVIRVDPRYFMKAVKDYLDISPEQAKVFKEVTGGEIPERFVIRKPYTWNTSDKERILYLTNQDILPNRAFYPSEEPSWWKEMWKLPTIRERIAFYNSHSR